jgi:hypothetical protein
VSLSSTRVIGVLPPVTDGYPTLASARSACKRVTSVPEAGNRWSASTRSTDAAKIAPRLASKVANADQSTQLSPFSRTPARTSWAAGIFDVQLLCLAGHVRECLVHLVAAV